MTQVFVYGTLKQGQRLNWVLKGSEFVKAAPTLRFDYDLISCGHFPAVIQGGTFRVLGEVYRVNPRTLKKLDFVERVPLFYQRKEIPILGLDEPAFIYVANPEFRDDLLTEQGRMPDRQINVDINARTKEWVWNR